MSPRHRGFASQAKVVCNCNPLWLASKAEALSYIYKLPHRHTLLRPTSMFKLGASLGAPPWRVGQKIIRPRKHRDDWAGKAVASDVPPAVRKTNRGDLLRQALQADAIYTIERLLPLEAVPYSFARQRTWLSPWLPLYCLGQFCPIAALQICLS